MPNSILHKRSSTAGVVPHAALLANGEIALNSADGTWFIKKTDGTVLDLRQPLIVEGTTINADAQDWQTRVIAAGGTVSASTFTAVNNFCNAITATGIRDRFYRLNLFCGNNLAACLVPLYRGPSLSGTQYGNTTDTNGNFVSGDYVETGTSGGLKGDGSTKYLSTGVTFATVPVEFCVLSVYASEMETSGSSINFSLVGNTRSNGGFVGANLQSWWNFGPGQRRMENTATGGVAVSQTGTVPTAAFVCAGHLSGTTYAMYSNGVSVATSSATLTAQTTNTLSDLLVFARNNPTDNTTPRTLPANFTSARMRAYSIGISMTAAQQVAFYNAMQTFQAALNRLPPIVSNTDAQDWINRVYTAGGTVSMTTAAAVNNFCSTIDAAGIRDRFYRLNLFCGDNLTACLVPLYRGQSLGGTQFGNATDTNNSFVSGDYVETGVTGGLKGDGSAKYLNTGLNVSDLPLGNRHISVYEVTKAAGQYRVSIGNRNTNAFFELDRELDSPPTYTFYGMSEGGGRPASDIAYTTSSVHFLGQNASTTLSTLFKNGVAVGSNSLGTVTTAPTAPVFVFALRNGAIVSDFSDVRLGSYSLGLSMTDAQVAAYTSAMRTFQAALGRRGPVVSNADAQNWIDRVYAAGGTVSQSTAAAVNTFCNSINSTGLRDRFYRLNLFCGNDLTACLVPLYRGPSLTGTQFGNATDTNNNFVSSDYVETGVNGGLRGGSNKGLNTGVPVNFSTATDTHLAAYESALTTGNDRPLIGIDTNPVTPRVIYSLYHLSSAQLTYYDGTDAGNPFFAGTRVPAFFIGSNQSTRRDLFLNGVTVASAGAAKTVTGTQTSPNFTVFSFPNAGGFFYNGKLNAYSLGYALNATAAQAYYNIMQAFQTTLNRAV